MRVPDKKDPLYVAVLLLASIPAAAQNYAIVDLGTLTQRNSAATAASETGFIVGFSSVSGDFSGEPWFNHAFRWVAGVMTDLGVLGPDVPPEVFPKPESWALGVNAAGEVVGKANQPFKAWEGFLWLPAAAYGFPAGMNKIPDLPGGSTQLQDINDAGWIVGESRPTGSIGPRPVLWRYDGAAWTITDLGDLGGPYGRAQAVNEKGQVVGQANGPDGSLRSFLWLPEPDYGLPAGIHDLHPSYGSGNAYDINDKGQVTGAIGSGAPYLWLPAPAYGLPAGISLLKLSDIPNAVGAWPYGISNAGVVVGQVALYFPSGERVFKYRAFIWQSGKMQLLQDLLPPDSGWTILVNAYDVTESGAIVGDGMPTDQPLYTHAFRMAPVSFALGDLNCDGKINAFDIDPFVLALTDPAGYDAAYPDCDRMLADINDDGKVDAFDIDPFVELLIGG